MLLLLTKTKNIYNNWNKIKYKNIYIFFKLVAKISNFY